MNDRHFFQLNKDLVDCDANEESIKAISLNIMYEFHVQKSWSRSLSHFHV